ncbi:hypothetical protein ES705_25184 [subsurface metagenome]
MISKLIRCKLTFKYLRRLNFNSEICVWLERRNIMNKSKKINQIKINQIIIKKEKLILSYLWIITSIFGIFFYTFIIVDGFGFLISIFSLILGASITILLLKGKLSSIKKSRNYYLGALISQYILGGAYFLTFIVNMYRNPSKLIFSLAWLAMGVYNSLLYVKYRKI